MLGPLGRMAGLIVRDIVIALPSPVALHRKTAPASETIAASRRRRNPGVPATPAINVYRLTAAWSHLRGPDCLGRLGGEHTNII